MHGWHHHDISTMLRAPLDLEGASEIAHMTYALVNTGWAWIGNESWGWRFEEGLFG